ncbi:MAG: hypothetical protein IT236_00175, partial [Bacteroidia bacterium]|nr:hypothetical protein [Bacteroidia bacterium]
DDQNFYLSNSFICAALCNDTAAEIAVDILVWVNQWAGASFTYKHQEFVQLFFQSSSLSMFIKSSITAQNNGGHYVPELNGSVYEALISTINTELTNNYNNYLTLFTATQVDKNFIDVAQTMQGIYQNDVANYTSLLAQAQQEYQSALDAENKANENFQLQQIQVVTQGNNLNDVGIPEFKEKEIFKAIIDIGKALVTFGIGIAGMATGNEETAPVAAEGAIEAVQAAKAASATVDAMKNLKKLMDLLNKLYTLANSIYTAASGIKNPNNPIDPATAGAQGLNGYDSINSTAAWDVYQIQLDQSMTPLVTAGIQYADDYKAALDCLVVYGKALAAAKIATIKACQKVVSAQVELAYSQANTQSIVNLVSTLKTNQGEMAQLQKLFYQKYLNTKLTLYTLLKNYEATYFYWALTPYPYPVNFIDFNGLSTNNNQLINLQLAEYAALANFNGHLPQNMPSIKATVDMSTIVRNSQNTVLTWNLSTANSAFAQLARVRFDRVRVWLDGQNLYPTNPPGAGVVCKFHVSTSGNYADTDMTGNQQLFCTGRYNFEFEYTVNTRQQVSSYDWVFADNTNLIATVNLDGEIPTNLQNDYIQPTPFSEWTLSFAADSGIDVNNISSITMDFEGSAISLVKGAK